MKVLVLTISDRASQGVYEDKSGPAIKEILNEKLPDTAVDCLVVPDEEEAIYNAFCENLDKEVILTTGGTGIGPRDITPEVTEKFCERLIPGIAEYLRSESIKQTVNATLSRGVAGIKDQTIIINLPGSVKGAAYCTNLLIPIVLHAVKMARGEGH